MRGCGMKAPLTSMATDVLAYLDGGGSSLRPCRRSLFEIVAATRMNRPAVEAALEELWDRELISPVEWVAVAERSKGST